LRWKVPNISCNDKIGPGFERALQHPIVIWIPRCRYFFLKHNECGNLSKVSDESCCPALIETKVVAAELRGIPRGEIPGHNSEIVSRSLRPGWLPARLF